MALAGVGCCNSGIPRENTELKTGSANSVGKSPQPISIPISPNFPEFFPDFVFSRKYGIRSGKSRYGVGRYRIFPFPLSSLLIPHPLITKDKKYFDNFTHSIGLYVGLKIIFILRQMEYIITMLNAEANLSGSV